MALLDMGGTLDHRVEGVGMTDDTLLQMQTLQGSPDQGLSLSARLEAILYLKGRPLTLEELAVPEF